MPTPETVPDNHILVQFIRAEPAQGLLTVSPAKQNGLYTLKESLEAHSNAISQKTAKRYMSAAQLKYSQTHRYEEPKTITLALPIDPTKDDYPHVPNEEHYEAHVRKADAICWWLHQADIDITQALQQRAEHLLGPAPIHKPIDPFDL